MFVLHRHCTSATWNRVSQLTIQKYFQKAIVIHVVLIMIAFMIHLIWKTVEKLAKEAHDTLMKISLFPEYLLSQ